MFYFILHIIFIFITFAAAASNSKVITYDNSANVIVKDLVENWESPFVYLKSRGYLKDMQSAPDLDDFQQQLRAGSDQELPFNKDSKRELNKQEYKYDFQQPLQARSGQEFSFNKENKYDSRAARSLEGAKDQELKQMFHKLFSSNNETFADELKSKLNVNWNMDALKFSARQSASKYMKDQEDLIVKANKASKAHTASLTDREPLVLEPLVKEAKMKELLFKDKMFDQDLYKKPMVKDPFAVEPLLKKHLYKAHLFEEPVAKDNTQFDNPNFLSGLGKILSSPQMRGKDAAANQENPENEPLGNLYQ